MKWIYLLFCALPQNIDPPHMSRAEARKQREARNKRAKRGKKVGVLALQSANDKNLTRPYPLDTLGAMTQGMIGYWLLQALQNHLPGRHVAAIVNQTLVLSGDPAFENPTTACLVAV